jgi:DNA-binding transcriptional LysR family regulator
LAEAAEETRESQGLTSGLIRVSAPMSLGLKFLPAVLSQFAAIHPQTRVAVMLSDSFVDIVEEDYDLAIRISGAPTDKSTIWRKICPVPRILVASPAYLAARGTPEIPDDLADFCCLSYSDGPSPEEWKLSSGQSHLSHVAKGAFCANNGDLLARLAANGEGIALLPRFIVEDDLNEGRMVQVLADWELPEIWLTLYYPPYDRLPLRVATFSDFFEIYAKEMHPI